MRKSRAASHRMLLFALERLFAPLFLSVCVFKEIEKRRMTFAAAKEALKVAREHYDAEYAAFFDVKLSALEAEERALCEEPETSIPIDKFTCPPTHQGILLLILLAKLFMLFAGSKRLSVFDEYFCQLTLQQINYAYFLYQHWSEFGFKFSTPFNEPIDVGFWAKIRAIAYTAKVATFDHGCWIHSDSNANVNNGRVHTGQV